MLTPSRNASGSYKLSATGTRASSEAGGSSTLPSTGGDSDSLLNQLGNRRLQAVHVIWNDNRRGSSLKLASEHYRDSSTGQRA